MEPESLLILKLQNPKTKNRAFCELLDLYQERLYWFIRKIVVSHENANDVLQNTFIKISDGINTFDKKSTLLTWMFRIAHNEAIRFIQQNKNQSSTSVDDLPRKIEILANDDYFDGEELKMKLHQIVGGLTEKQRQVFQMKYFDDLSFKEVSEILNISENTLKSSYYSAVKIIEEKILICNYYSTITS